MITKQSRHAYQIQTFTNGDWDEQSRKAWEKWVVVELANLQQPIQSNPNCPERSGFIQPRNKQMSILTIEERTKAIIDGFRGLPEEFGMLKGLLCASYALEKGVKAKFHDAPDSWLNLEMANETKILDRHYNRIVIAERMDELRKEASVETNRVNEENRLMKDALISIASFDDYGADDHLKKTGSYKLFDNPSSVCSARVCLKSLK